MRLTSLTAVLIGLCLSSAAFAQPTIGDVRPNLNPNYRGRGQVRFFFFRANGLPVEGVRVGLDGETVGTSDGEGMALVDLKAGNYEFAFRFPGGRTFDTRQPVPVLKNQETEILITLPAKGEPFVDLEAPGQAISGAADDETLARGEVTGVLTSEKDGKPVSGARIFVRGTSADARSDAQGKFRIELPVGRRELTIIHPGYDTQTAKDIEVKEAEVTEVSIRMATKSRSFATMVITAPRIEGSAISVLEERQNSSNVADVLGADQISKAGDSDAASALSRVTGITVVGGRFVYVRGLGERYSSTLLNGSNLPSPDPERRVVPLDLFPASAIAGIEVQKTFSADIPGEFGGGIVKIKTKDIPEDFTASLSLSAGYHSVATFSDGLTIARGPTDWLGFGNGYRSLPGEFSDAISDRSFQPFNALLRPDGFSDGELERFAEMLDPNFGAGSTTVRPDFGASAEVGGKFELFGYKAGAHLSANYSNKWDTNDNAFRTTAVIEDTGALRILKNQRILTTGNEVSLTTLGTFGLDFDDDNDLRLTLGVFRISEATAGQGTGFDDDRGQDVFNTRLQWSERMVSTNQLRGRNLLSKPLNLRLDWRYQVALATRGQPDRKSVRYTEEPDGRFAVDPDGTERFFSDLLDVNHDLGTDFSMPVNWFGGRESTLKSGLAVEIKSRGVDVRRLSYIRRFLRDPDELGPVQFLPPEQLFQPDVIEERQQVLQETTRSDDNYTAAQQVVGAYFLGDLAVLDSLKVQAGLRLEYSNQRVEVSPLPGQDESMQDPSELTTIDPLPSVTATWAFYEDMQLRAGFARTVNRPSFRELSSAAFIDLARAREFRGNPDLQRATLLHFDLRYEWYPSPGESVSVAAFAKLIQSPIEYSLSGGSNQVGRPINTAGAENLGLEFEARKNFGFLGDFFADMYFAGNLTLVSSQVDTGLSSDETILTSLERPLQGQSPYAVNLQLGYDNIESRTSVSVLFNVFGRRINDVGVQGLPDIYEESRPDLSLVIKQGWERFSFGLKVQNLLNQSFRLTQTEPREGGEVVEVERYQEPIYVSVGIGMALD